MKHVPMTPLSRLGWLLAGACCGVLAVVAAAKLTEPKARWD